MNLKSISRVVLAMLLAVNLTLLGSGVLVMYQVNQLQDEWKNYSLIAEKKLELLNALNRSLGYGGMIHNLKNYLLRQQAQSLTAVHHNLDTLETVIARYLNLPINDAEKAAMAELERVLQAYRRSAVAMESLTGQGNDLQTIDRQIKVDDSEALKALQVLHQSMTDNRNQTEASMVLQVDRLHDIALAFGILTSVLMLSLFGYLHHTLQTKIIRPVAGLAEVFKQANPALSTVKHLPVDGSLQEVNTLARAGNRFLDVN